MMNGNCRYHLWSLLLLIGIDMLSRTTFAQISVNSASLVAIKDQIIRLERIVSAQGQLLIQLQNQLSDNQNDIDLLRGQIQNRQHQLDHLVDHQKQIILQLNSLGGNINTSMQVDRNKEVTSAVIINTGSSNSTYVHKNNEVSTHYNTALSLVQDQLRQDDAIMAFKDFIKNHPNSIYQPNANYWLGQLYYNKGKKDDAVFYFASVVKNYPKSSKAPDAMFKVGLIMQNKGEIVKAKAVYQQILIKYPNTNEAKQARKHLISMK